MPGRPMAALAPDVLSSESSDFTMAAPSFLPSPLLLRLELAAFILATSSCHRGC
jgi:hypothetical protein